MIVKGLTKAAILLALASCSSSDGVLPDAGSWRVINYWATWCTPCREEIPELNHLNELSDVTVLGVNYDGKTGIELSQQVNEMAIGFEVLSTDPSEALGIRVPRVLPTTLLVDPTGRLQQTLVGPQTKAAIITALAELGRVNTSRSD